MYSIYIINISNISNMAKFEMTANSDSKLRISYDIFKQMSSDYILDKIRMTYITHVSIVKNLDRMAKLNPSRSSHFKHLFKYDELHNFISKIKRAISICYEINKLIILCANDVKSFISNDKFKMIKHLKDTISNNFSLTDKLITFDYKKYVDTITEFLQNIKNIVYGHRNKKTQTQDINDIENIITYCNEIIIEILSELDNECDIIYRYCVYLKDFKKNIGNIFAYDGLSYWSYIEHQNINDALTNMLLLEDDIKQHGKILSDTQLLHISEKSMRKMFAHNCLDSFNGTYCINIYDGDGCLILSTYYYLDDNINIDQNIEVVIVDLPKDYSYYASPIKKRRELIISRPKIIQTKDILMPKSTQLGPTWQEYDNMLQKYHDSYDYSDIDTRSFAIQYCFDMLLDHNSGLVTSAMYDSFKKMAYNTSA
jgi:hypothetical protein